MFSRRQPLGWFLESHCPVFAVKRVIDPLKMVFSVAKTPAPIFLPGRLKNSTFWQNYKALHKVTAKYIIVCDA
jgi:hypothetical protein